MERNWYVDKVKGEVPYSEVVAKSDEYTHWNYEAFEPVEIGYEDLEETLRTKYSNEVYQNSSEERKKEIVDEVLAIYRERGIYPNHYLSPVGVMTEIEKCIDYNAKFEGDTVSCVDGNTEFFTGTGWKKIKNYVKGDKVLQYNGLYATLVEPLEYIHYKSDEPFYKYKGNNFTSCITGSHDIVYTDKDGELKKIKQEVVARDENSYKIPITFFYGGTSEIKREVLILLAISLGVGYTLLEDGEVVIYMPEEKFDVVYDLIYKYDLHVLSDRCFSNSKGGIVEVIKFRNIFVTNILRTRKVPTFWYNISKECKCLFIDVLLSLNTEVINLDHDKDNTDLLDFLQFVFASTGICCKIYSTSVPHAEDKKYTPSQLLITKVAYGYYEKDCPYEMIEEEDKYCFNVPSHMLVLRKNKSIFITGNCGAGVGTALCNFMFPNLCNTPSLHDLNKKNARTMYERFYNDKFLRKAIRFCYSYKEGSPTPMAVMSGLRLVGSAPSNFRPMNAKAIYERFCPDGGTIWDPCCGFGGRLLGALSSKKNFRYVGTDPCTETMYNLHRLGEEIEYVTGREDSYELHCCGSEVFKGKPNSIDFVFTSPPYFNLEIYSTEETQCFNKYPELNDWLEGYVRQTIKNIYHMLKPERYCAINIADFKVHGGDMVAFVDEWIRISTEEGMPLYDTVYLGVTARAGSRQFQFGEKKKENILIFKKPLK